MSKVYVVNYAEHNMEAAKKYGELIYVSEGRYTKIFHPSDIVVDFKSRLKDIQIEDHLLLSGSPILNCIAFMIAVCKNEEVRVLLFDARERNYVSRTIKGKELVC